MNGAAAPPAMLLRLLRAGNLYPRGSEAGMDPDEQSYEQEEDQDDESAFGLYGVEDEGEGPCGGCQGTWLQMAIVVIFQIPEKRFEYNHQ